MKVYQPRTDAPPPRSPDARTFDSEDGIVAWLLSDPGPDPLPAIAAAHARAEAARLRAARTIVHLVRRTLARAKQGWIGREEAANYIDSGGEAHTDDPAHWTACRAVLAGPIRAWHRARWA